MPESFVPVSRALRPHIYVFLDTDVLIFEKKVKPGANGHVEPPGNSIMRPPRSPVRRLSTARI